MVDVRGKPSARHGAFCTSAPAAYAWAMAGDPHLTLRVRLTPRGGREEVKLLDDGSLAVRVAAPPVDGRANEALRRAVAKALGIAPSCVQLVRGDRSRQKTLSIEGLNADEVRARLAPQS